MGNNIYEKKGTIESGNELDKNNRGKPAKQTTC